MGFHILDQPDLNIIEDAKRTNKLQVFLMIVVLILFMIITQRLRYIWKLQLWSALKDGLSFVCF